MLFVTEADKNNHPQAHLIPAYAFETIFFRQLSEFESSLMQYVNISSQAFSEQLAQVKNNTQYDEKKSLQYWICIVLGHQELSDDELILLSNKLEMNLKSTFLACSITGRTSLLNKIATNSEVKDYLSEAFGQAAANGQVAVLDELVKLFPDKKQDMIAADHYGAFRKAASKGQLAILDKLMAWAPDKISDMLAAKDYIAFEFAATHGHLAVVEKLIPLITPSKLQEIIVANEYDVLSTITQCGYVAILDKLIENLSESALNDIRDFVTNQENEVFRWTAAGGHLAMVERLIKFIAPDEVRNMIAADNNEAFRWAVTNQRIPIVNRLLSFSFVFAYAEAHSQEYGNYTHPFANNELAALRDRKTALAADEPHTVFDLTDPEEIKLCFFIARNLIRRNDPALLDDLRFLLDIPAIRALAHTAVGEHEQANELIRLAVSKRNEGASEILLSIPAVDELARQHDYYRNAGHLDLRTLAANRESSMRALTESEQQRLESAIFHYQPLIKQAGTSHIIQDLRDTLIERYDADPASIQLKNGETLTLPANWQAFQNLKLEGEAYQKALFAYYQHKDHSALRFLSKPNPWMHKNAAYVNANPNHPSERWSCFEDYQPLIAMLWLGATDEKITPTQGFTIPDRINHFIDELALLGRAHNWDNSRVKLDSNGKPILDKKRHVVTEEYDDFEDDRPSCFSGAKTRLFQSVMGHPLFEILTQELVKQELRDFVREYIKPKITSNTIEDIREAWKRIIIDPDQDLNETHKKALEALTIKKDDQDHFIKSLKDKYGKQFAGFEKYIKNQFNLNKHEYHVTKLDGLINFQSLLPLDNQNKNEVSQVTSALAQTNLFTPKQDRNPDRDKENFSPHKKP